MRFSPPLQYLERGPGGEVSESPDYTYLNGLTYIYFQLHPPIIVSQQTTLPIRPKSLYTYHFHLKSLLRIRNSLLCV